MIKIYDAIEDAARQGRTSVKIHCCTVRQIITNDLHLYSVSILGAFTANNFEQLRHDGYDLIVDGNIVQISW